LKKLLWRDAEFCGRKDRSSIVNKTYLQKMLPNFIDLLSKLTDPETIQDAANLEVVLL